MRRRLRPSLVGSALVAGLTVCASPLVAAQTPAADITQGVAVTASPKVTSAEAARRAGRLTRAPSQALMKRLFEGGTWRLDIAHGGSWLSGYKNAKEYGDPDFTPPNPIPLKPGPMAVYKTIRRENGRGRQIFGPYAQCHPAGMP